MHLTSIIYVSPFTNNYYKNLHLCQLLTLIHAMLKKKKKKEKKTLIRAGYIQPA